MATYSLYTQSFGRQYKNIPVKITEVGTGKPAIVMARSNGGVISHTGDAKLDGNGSLNVYLDSKRVWEVTPASRPPLSFDTNTLADDLYGVGFTYDDSIKLAAKLLMEDSVSKVQAAKLAGVLDLSSVEVQYLKDLVLNGQGPGGTDARRMLGVLTVTDMASIPSPAAGLSCELMTEDQSSTYTFTSGNLSAQVSADPTKTNYVAPNSAPTGASGAWVRNINSTSVLTVGLFSNLSSKKVPVGIDIIETSGYSTPGVGGARYVSTTNTGANRYRVQTANGRWFELAESNPDIEQFGAVGNQASFDSYPAIQAAVDWSEARLGGHLYADGSKTYYLSQSLTIDPVRTGLDFRGATLDWALKTFVDPNSQPELLTNGSFDSGSTGWTISQFNTNTLSFTGGVLQSLQADTVAHAAYMELGQIITAPLNSTIQVTMTIGFIHSVLDTGSNTPFYSMLMAFGRSDKPVGQMAVFASKSIKNTSPDYSEPMTVTFETSITTAANVNPWFRMQSNASVQINDVSIKVVPDNHLILFRCKSDKYGHNRYEVKNVKLRGRSDQVANVTGVIYDSTTPLSSRVNAYNLEFDGPTIGLAMYFKNATYLLSFFGCHIQGKFGAIKTLDGAIDAGENISFHGGVIGSAFGPAVVNNGMGLFFFSTSIDFPKTFYQGFGTCEVWSGWFEKNAVSTADTYLVDVTGGSFRMFGGRIQIDGAHVDAADAPFRVTDGGIIELFKVNCSNMGSTEDVLAVGDGYFYSTGMTGGSNMPAIGMRRDDMNVFGDGDFTASTISLPIWVDSIGAAGAASEQTDRYSVAWRIKGTFAGNTATNNDTITGTSIPAGTIQIGDELSGKGVPPGAVVGTWTNTGGTITSVQMTGRANAGGTGNTFTWTRAATATASASLSTSKYRTGTQSLRFYKSLGIGNGNSARLNILMPVESIRRLGMEFYYSVTPDPGAPADSTTQFYITGYFANILDTPATKIPVVAQSMYAGLDATQVIDRRTGFKVINGTVQSDEWNKVNFSTLYVDPNWPHKGFPPAWATHLWIRIELVSCPPGFELFLDNFLGSLL